MTDLTNYIVNNKEWIFSGIGVFFLTIFFGFLFHRRKTGISQNIKSGNNSTNIQVGGDMSSGALKKSDNKKKS